MNSGNRAITNTAISYISLLVRLVIGFISFRYLLLALGESNYGTYMLVAGVLSMFEILNSNMTNSTMRYMSHSLGSNDEEKIIRTFNTSLRIHYLVGVISIVLIEIGGWIMFEYFLNIPDDLIFGAKVVYQFMVVTSFINIIGTPYDAVINAHEHIWFLSLTEVLNTLLKFGFILLLMNFKGDRLILYGFLMLILSVILRALKVWYSKKKYIECKKNDRNNGDKRLFKEILSFTGWNLFGSLSSLASTQFRSILINMFFGVRLNAAEGISKQVGGYVNGLSTSMTRAINPQIMKSEGGGDRKRMIYITEIGSKYSAFLFMLICIPLIVEAPFILRLWLKDVPEFAVIFTQLFLITMLIEKFTFQITHALRAVGIIRGFQITESILNLVYLPIVYFAYKNGLPAVTIYYAAIVVCVLVAISRLYFGRKVAGIIIIQYVRNVIIPVFIAFVLPILLTYTIFAMMPEGILSCFVVFVVFDISFVFSFLLLGMGKSERMRWNNMVKDIYNNFFKKK